MFRRKQLCAACNCSVVIFYCEQCIMALAEFDFVKELSVSHESYRSDDYSTEHFVFFLPPVVRADMTSIWYFQFSALEFSFCNFNQPMHTVVIRGMIIFLKPPELLHIADISVHHQAVLWTPPHSHAAPLYCVTILYARHVHSTRKNFCPFCYIRNRSEYR